MHNIIDTVYSLFKNATEQSRPIALFLWRMITLKSARKILGKLAENISDEELERELETASMIAEIVLMKYKEERGKINTKSAQNA